MITIIVLLIIAGVTINMIVGDSGLLSKAQWTKFITNFSQVQEEVDLYALQVRTEEHSDKIKIASTETIMKNGEEKEIFPIKDEIIDNSYINNHEGLELTIKEVEHIDNITAENVELYNLDKKKISSESRDEYIINVKSGKIYLKEAYYYKGKIYYRPEIGVNKKGEAKATIKMEDIILKEKETGTLNVTKDGTVISNSEVIFESENNNIATVDENGVVIGVSKGETTIIGKLKKDNEVTTTCKITVNEKIYAHTDYIQEGLVVLYDGEYNTRENGHNNTAKIWENLAENENDGILNNIDFTTASGWTDNSLILDGIDDWVAMSYLHSDNMTIEICAKPLDVSINKNQYYIGNVQNGGISIKKTVDDKNSGMQYFSEYYYDESENNIKINQIYSMSTGNNGSNQYFCENGEIFNQEISGNFKKPDSSTIFAIGTNPNGTSDGLQSDEKRFNIEVYSVRIYNRCLTEEEIINNYNVDNKRFKIKNVQVEETPNYVSEGLVCLLDGSKNTKYGHSERTNIWQNLAGTTDASLKNVNYTKESGWGTNYLTLDGVNDWVNVGKNHYSTMTIEIVAEPLKIESGKNQHYLANIETGGIRISKDVNGNNMGGAYISKSYRILYSNNLAKENKKYSMSTGFDGTYLYFRENNDLYSSNDYSGGITNPNTVFAIGTNPRGTSDDLGSNEKRFNMKVYSVRIYNRCLTQDEIQRNYEVDKVRFGISE